MTQTSGDRPAIRPEAVRWRPVIAVLVAGVVGLGGVQFAAHGWTDAKRALASSIDRMLWTHALKNRPAVSDLNAAAPVWREREGASGDRIIERVDTREAASRGGAPAVSVLDDTGGSALPAAVLAEQAARPEQPADRVHPASFEGLGEGDRVTITTTAGRVYVFEVIRQGGKGAVPETREQRFVLRMLAPEGAAAEAIEREIKPIGTPRPVTAQPQQEL